MPTNRPNLEEAVVPVDNGLCLNQEKLPLKLTLENQTLSEVSQGEEDNSI